MVRRRVYPRNACLGIRSIDVDLVALVSWAELAAVIDRLEQRVWTDRAAVATGAVLAPLRVLRRPKRFRLSWTWVHSASLNRSSSPDNGNGLCGSTACTAR